MESQRSDTADILLSLRHAIWHRDWDDARNLIVRLSRAAETENAAGLQVLLSALSKSLTEAKAARLEMVSSLGRLRIAAGFIPASEYPVQSGKFPPIRQLPGGCGLSITRE